MRIIRIGRDARNGRFISVRNAKERPSTTTVETMEISTHGVPPQRPSRSGRRRLDVK